MSTTLSAIVIAKNEAVRLSPCLSHLAWADELILVDNGSTDDTQVIAKKHGAIIISAPQGNFSELREAGRKKAKSDWILYVDADEEIPDVLQKEIQHTMHTYTEGKPTGYFIKRDSYYLGHHWPYADRMQRLFLARALTGWSGILHETAVFEGDVGELTHPLIHHTHRTLEEMVTKTNEWSEIEAKLRFEAHHPPIVWWRLIRVMLTGFFRSFFAQGGWKAGTVGWIESIYQAFSMFITYAKLWEMQQNNKLQIKN